MKEIKALLPFAKPYRNLILLATVSMVIMTAMNLAGPWAVRGLIQTVTESADSQGDLARVSFLAFAVVIIYCVRAVSCFASDYIAHLAAWRMLRKIRKYLYDHIQNLSLGFFQDKQTGELMSRVINDTRNFEVLLAHAIPTLVVNGIMFIGISAILFSMNTTLTLLTLIPAPLLGLMVLKFSSMSRPLFREAQDKIGDVNAILQDNFSGVKEIKSFTQESHESGKVDQSLWAYTHSILKALKLSNAFHPSIEFVSGLGTVIVIFFGGRLALGGTLPIEDLVAFLLYLEMFYRPIMALGRINEGLQQGLGSAERVIELMGERPEVEEKADAIHRPEAQGYLEFQNVSFRYVEHIPVVENISFAIKPGETLALVGATGVGKTTIASLIPRFYDPDSGEIFLDHINIKDLSLASLRSHISLVSQDVFLFNGTIKENICYGCHQASHEEIMTAAKAANAHTFILELEHGYDTRVGERGVKLSGGQKQRISIARALLKDAPILILDEATSSVDTQTEKLIQEALHRLMENKTTVVIAHRLSTIKEAHEILVLEEGKVRERGTHEELIKARGLYRSLCDAQDTRDLAV